MKAPLGIYNTEICVVCLKRKAKWHTGHVLASPRRKILAGLCEWCHRRLDANKLKGFVGHWLPEMNPDEAARRAKERA